MKIRILLSALALLAATSIVSAQTSATLKQKEKTAKQSQAFVDNNNNGVCDNFEKQQAEGKKEKGKGECCGKKKADCKEQAVAQGQAYGDCKGNCQGQCREKCKNFADANNDGVCDNKKVAKK
jgi:hypothetical protein